MTGARSFRTELLDELAGAQLFAAETRSSALRRSERLLRIIDQLPAGRTRAALLVARRSVLLVSEAAEDLLEDLAGDLGELMEDDSQRRGA